MFVSNDSWKGFEYRANQQAEKIEAVAELQRLCDIYIPLWIDRASTDEERSLLIKQYKALKEGKPVPRRNK